MRSQFRRLVDFFTQRQLLLGVIVTIVAALSLTAFSIWSYNGSDVARLDISRPGYESARGSVIKGGETTNFSATGELDAKALNDFQKLFDSKRKAMQAIGKFESDALDNEQLKISAP